MRILGVDLALNLTGLVALSPEWLATGSPDWSSVQHRLLDCRDLAYLHPVDRRASVIDRVLRVAVEFKADAFACEESFAARNSSAALLSKLHGELERRCHREHVDLVKVTRGAAYKLATGKGNASKEVLQAVLRSMGAPFSSSLDCCDAWAAANCALADRGFLGVAA